MIATAIGTPKPSAPKIASDEFGKQICLVPYAR